MILMFSEHISSLLSPDGNIYSAPALMPMARVATNSPDTVTPLMNFTYLALGDPVQTFVLPGAGMEARWRMVELIVHNNHGYQEHACLFRLRVTQK